MALLLNYDGEDEPKEVKEYSFSGLYSVSGFPDDEIISPLRVKYLAGYEDYPVVVVHPGYRMRGVEGFVCNKMAEMLQTQGYSVLIYDYRGFEATRTDAEDAATMTSNIEDSKVAIKFLGNRLRIDLSISYGVNVAMFADDYNCIGRVNVLPAPDHIQHSAAVCFDEDAYSTEGFFYGPDPLNLKITHKFFKDASQYSIVDAMGKNVDRPHRLILSNDDDVVDSQVVSEFIENLQLYGYNLNIRLVEGVQHIPEEPIFMAALFEVGAVAQVYFQRQHNDLASDLS
ncbi:MAG: alpha/beta hydrolase family protein [Alphaproteobacteria bacterium]